MFLSNKLSFYYYLMTYFFCLFVLKKNKTQLNGFSCLDVLVVKVLITFVVIL